MNIWFTRLFNSKRRTFLVLRSQAIISLIFLFLLCGTAWWTLSTAIKQEERYDSQRTAGLVMSAIQHQARSLNRFTEVLANVRYGSSMAQTSPLAEFASAAEVSTDESGLAVLGEVSRNQIEVVLGQVQRADEMLAVIARSIDWQLPFRAGLMDYQGELYLFAHQPIITSAGGRVLVSVRPLGGSLLEQISQQHGVQVFTSLSGQATQQGIAFDLVYRNFYSTLTLHRAPRYSSTVVQLVAEYEAQPLSFVVSQQRDRYIELYDWAVGFIATFIVVWLLKDWISHRLFIGHIFRPMVSFLRNLRRLTLNRGFRLLEKHHWRALERVERRFQQQLEHTDNERLFSQLIIDSIRDVLIVVGQDGCINMANPAAQQLLDNSNDALKDSMLDFHLLLLGSEGTSLDSMVRQCIRGERKSPSDHLLVQRRSPDFKRPCRINLYPLTFSTETYGAVVLIQMLDRD